MNLAVVTRAAAGLVGWLAAQGGQGPLVIGYDARHGSRDFAEQTARVATGAGREALLLPRPLPTPVLAYAVRAPGRRGRRDGHRQPQPAAGQRLQGLPGRPARRAGRRRGADRAARRRRASRPPSGRSGRLAEVPLGDPGTVLDETIVQGYVDSAAAVVGAGPRDLTVAYTPLHGVGGAGAGRGVHRGRLRRRPRWSPSRPSRTRSSRPWRSPTRRSRARWTCCSRWPRGSAPTSPSPTTPTPTGARSRSPATEPGSWRPLRGDELGVLLADHLIRRGATGHVRHHDRLVARCCARCARPGACRTPRR